MRYYRRLLSIDKPVLVDTLIATTASGTRMNLMESINLKTMDVTIDSYEKINSNSMVKHFDLLRAKYPTASYILHLILD